MPTAATKPLRQYIVTMRCRRGTFLHHVAAERDTLAITEARKHFNRTRGIASCSEKRAYSVRLAPTPAMVPQVCQQQQAKAVRTSAEPQADKPRKTKKPRAAASYRAARRRAAVAAARQQRKLIRAALKARPLTVELPRIDDKNRRRECTRRLRQMQKAAA